MSRFRLMSTPAVLIALMSAPLLAACGDSSEAAGGQSVAVDASDDACKVAKTELESGPVTFDVSNKGSKVTEVYIYGEKDGAYSKIVSEVENIGPGTSRDLSVKLGGGTYEVACKPGQKGDGIRTKITVTGAKAEAGDSKSYDREIELSVGANGVEGLDGAKAATGEKIEFKLENETDATRELVLVDPSGKEVAEIEVAPATTGETVVELSTAGSWTVKVEGGTKDIETPLPVG
jgi:iron uptake system component EfeO